MIELYDAARLSIRRDHTLVIAGSTLLVAAGLMGAYTVFLQLQLTSARQRTQTLQADLTGVDTAGRPAATRKDGDSGRPWRLTSIRPLVTAATPTR